MNAPTILNTLPIAVPAAILLFTAQAVPAFAAPAQDEANLTRAGGPRVELRVTPAKREPTRMAARTTRYARG